MTSLTQRIESYKSQNNLTSNQVDELLRVNADQTYVVTDLLTIPRTSWVPSIPCRKKSTRHRTRQATTTIE